MISKRTTRAANGQNARPAAWLKLASACKRSSNAQPVERLPVSKPSDGWTRPRPSTATSHQQAELAALYARLLRFEQENAANSESVEAEFRLDAGFGTYENVALLIEMGYDLYTKPHSHKIVAYLKQQVDDSTAWVRVRANAELVVWPTLQLKHCPYPLDVALERFYTGTTLKHSALFHFGAQPMTEQLPGWFEQYNGRQTTLARMKESKQVFYLHHLKVRSEPAISLQEAFILFAANFIRWAAHWLAAQAQPVENALNMYKLGIKRQVYVAAHVSAQVIQDQKASC